MKRRMRWGLLVLLLSWLGIRAGAQGGAGQAAGQAASAGQEVAGRVVDATDGRPLAGARVSLTEVGSGTESKSVLADEDGRFGFAGVRKGKWSLLGAKAGYIASAYLAHGELSTAIVTGAGISTENLVLTLRAKGVLAGSVTDESGEPVPRAMVQLFRVMPPGAAEPVRSTQMISTDAAGKFEFSSVIPGTFYLGVRALPWYAVNPPADAPNSQVGYRVSVDPELQVAYPTTYYPNARSSAEASPIEVHAGERVTANLQLTAERAVILRVRLPTAGDGRDAGFPQLWQDEFGVQQPAMVGQVQVQDGVAQLMGVAPGQYQLRVTQNGSAFSGSAQTVDLSGESVTVEGAAGGPGAEVTLRVKDTAAGGAAEPMFVQLQRDGNGQISGEPVDAEGEVLFTGVPAGTYNVRVLRQGRLLMVRSIAVDGRAVPGHKLQVSGSEPMEAAVELAGRPVEVRGRVERDGRPGAAAMVVLVPAGADTSAELFRRDQSDLDGSFSLPNVAPGNYVLVALDDGWALRWTDVATMLRYLPRGVAVTVPETGPAVLELGRAVVAQPAGGGGASGAVGGAGTGGAANATGPVGSPHP